MECDFYLTDQPDNGHPSLDEALAHCASVCVLISAPRETALGTARRIARMCRSGLSWIDCDSLAPRELADLLEEHLGVRTSDAYDRILFLREVQVLTTENQRLLNDLIASQRHLRTHPRLIASSSLSLYDAVRADLFDENLFYRLNAIHIVRLKADATVSDDES
jgi:hypothetical protein